MLTATVERHGGREAFGTRDDANRWTWMTWSELAAKVEALRGGLAQRGIGPGDRVAIISNNRVEWVIGAFAAYGLGASWVPMYEAMLDKDWKFILEDCGAKLCFCATQDIDARVAALLPELPRVCLGEDFEALCALGARAPVEARSPSPDDVAYFIYTSGTTGAPKGVRLTHKNLAYGAQALQLVFPLSREDRTLAFLPWAHVGGGAVELHAIVQAGASTAICPKPEWVLESLTVARPTVLLAVPRIWNRIYDGVNKQMAAKPAPIRALFRAGLQAAQKKAWGATLSVPDALTLALAKKLIFSKIVAKFGGRLQYACSGAAALSPEVGHFIKAIGIDVYEGYGMTEVSGLSTVNPLGAPRIGSVGVALPGVEIKLDKEAVTDDPRGGEIVIYGHGVMAGYHGLPGETKATMTEDGGLRSGDIGRIDDDGYVYITGRVKEIYKLENGKYVSPVPLEDKLTLSPLIAQAMVHGQDKPFNVAILVPDAPTLREWARESGIDASDLETLCTDARVRARYAEEVERFAAEKAFERIVDFVLVPRELSVDNDMLTPTMKIKRRVVVAAFAREIEGMYAAPRARG
ncbi:MAG: long-chain fatty acid--CoA ligase [Myxococcales bacterium]|nr:long-chain fatty acid--CoA ligase [Myxococcales bacterium]